MTEPTENEKRAAGKILLGLVGEEIAETPAVVREELRAYGHDPEALADRARREYRLIQGRQRRERAARSREAILGKLGELRARLGPISAQPGLAGAAAFRALETLDERDGLAVLEDERVLAELLSELDRLNVLSRDSGEPIEFALDDLFPTGDRDFSQP